MGDPLPRVHPHTAQDASTLTLALSFTEVKDRSRIQPGRPRRWWHDQRLQRIDQYQCDEAIKTVWKSGMMTMPSVLSSRFVPRLPYSRRNVLYN